MRPLFAVCLALLLPASALADPQPTKTVPATKIFFMGKTGETSCTAVLVAQWTAVKGYRSGTYKTQLQGDDGTVYPASGSITPYADLYDYTDGPQAAPAGTHWAEVSWTGQAGNGDCSESLARTRQLFPFPVEITLNRTGSSAAPFSATKSTTDPNLYNVASQFNESTATSNDGTAPYTYKWEYGDGKTGTGKTASHSYEKPGTYTITHRVFDAGELEWTSTKQVTVGSPSPLSVTLDGVVSGVDQVALYSTLRNSSPDVAVTDLTYPGTTGGLLFGSGQVTLLAGPFGPLPSSLSPGAQSGHGYVFNVENLGTVTVQAQAQGRAGTQTVSAQDAVQISATDYMPNAEQQQALAAGAYTSFADQIDADVDRALQQTADTINLAMKSFGPASADADLRKHEPSEDLLAELYGLPAGSLDFLPDSARSYLLWAESRSQGEWKAWKDELNTVADKTVREPLAFWNNQFFGADPGTKFKVGQELYNFAKEKGEGVKSFTSDAMSLVTVKSIKEIEAGLPALGREYRAAAKSAVVKAATVTKAEAKRIAQQFRKGDEQGIKASAEAFAKVEVKVSKEIGKAAIGGAVERRLEAIVRLRKAEKATEAVEAVAKIEGNDPSLAHLLPRTITDGLAPPTAAELGMGLDDQKLIGSVIEKLEAKAAAQGYPGLELEMGFRSRGYSAPGAIGKNQYLKAKTGGAIDVLLGMDERGLGGHSIFKPKLPGNLDQLPTPIQKALKMRYDEQLGVFKAYNAALDGKESKLTEVVKALGKKGNTFTNTVNGKVTDTTHMRLRSREAGNATILEYVDLNVNGRQIVKNTPTPIGSDYDGLYLGVKGGGKLPAGVKGLWLEANNEFTKLAQSDGFAWGFHGFSRDGFEFGEKAYDKVIWQYIAEGLPEEEARRLFGKTKKEVLDTMTFGQYLVKVTKGGASTGVLTP